MLHAHRLFITFEIIVVLADLHKKCRIKMPKYPRQLWGNAIYRRTDHKKKIRHCTGTDHIVTICKRLRVGVEV
jgi:hypothetical protein